MMRLALCDFLIFIPVQDTSNSLCTRLTAQLQTTSVEEILTQSLLRSGRR
jgi:hypothetical protein